MNLKDYVVDLQDRLSSRSELLEQNHMEAAIDFATDPTDTTNRYAVDNCFSPYVPATAERIAAFVEFVCLNPSDVLLDVGCGDGRVCVTTARRCKSIGVDVSPMCIEMAREVACAEGIPHHMYSFYEADMTLSPNVLLNESSPLGQDLKSVTVVFLYTYPTLLLQLIPLLSCLLEHGRLRAVVTLTYHLPESKATFERQDDDHDLRLYTKIKR